MYITPRQKRRYIWTSLIVAVAIPLTLVAGYFAVQYQSGAGVEDQPEDVVISNLTTNSLTVSWTTGSTNVGQIIVLTDGVASSPFIDTRGADSRQTHFVEIIGLAPSTEYDFKIISGGEEYLAENGSAFHFSTLALDDSNPIPDPLFGTVSGGGDDVVIFIVATGTDGSLPVSAVPSSTGNWIVDLSSMRTLDGSSQFIVSSDTQLALLAQGGGGKGAVQEGTKSELFNTDGKLEATLELQNETSVIALLPDQSLITSVIATTPPVTTPPVVTPPVTTPPVVTPPVTTPPVITPPVTEERQFIITSDINWGDLVLGASVSPPEQPDVEVGENTINISNHTDSGFSISWLTELPVEAYVLFGTDVSDLSEEAVDIKDTIVSKDSYYSHLIEVGDLLPETTYYYEIHSGDSTFLGTDDLPFEISTFATLSSPPPFETITGSVSGLGDPSDSVILLQIQDIDSEGTTGTSNLIAVVPDSNGSWIASIGDARNTVGDEYFISTDDDEVTIDMLAYAESEPQTVIKSEVETTNIVIEAVETASSGSDYTRVTELPDYGISSTAGINGVGSTTPKTAISKPLIISLTAGSVLLVFSILLLRKSSKETSNRSMVDRL